MEDFSGLESQSPVGVWKANRRAQAEDIPAGRGKGGLSWGMRLSLELRVRRESRNIEYRREEIYKMERQIIVSGVSQQFFYYYFSLFDDLHKTSENNYAVQIVRVDLKLALNKNTIFIFLGALRS